MNYKMILFIIWFETIKNEMDKVIIGFNGILDYKSGIIQNIYFRIINSISESIEKQMSKLLII